MTDAVIDEIDGRSIRIGTHWLVDYASCNYLGLDLDPAVMAAINAGVRRWGTHPSWSRLLGNPRTYIDIEDRLTALLGAPDSLLLPTITHIHLSVIPALAGRGTVFVERRAHKTIYDGAVHARALGATLRRFRAEDPDELAALLRDAPADHIRLVCLDGVNSMTGNLPDLVTLEAVCAAHGAHLYVDDAHGFGVIGQRAPTDATPYGTRGNGALRHLGLDYENTLLVGGFSKAYSSLLAFIALPTPLKDHLKLAAAPYLYSGPSPTASLFSALAGLDINDQRGDELRGTLHRHAARVLAHCHTLRLDTPNRLGTPIIELPLAEGRDLNQVSRHFWDRGIYLTVAGYPLVPRDEAGFRIQLTAAHTDAQIDTLLSALTALTTAADLRQTA